jgi:hypothetical protein
LVFAGWAVSDRLWCGDRARMLRVRVRAWARPAASAASG